MKILGHEMPPIPDDCPNGHECTTDLDTIEIFTRNAPPSHFADIPTDTPGSVTDNAYPAEIVAGIEHAVVRGGPPMDKRCTECVVRCAFAALSGDVVHETAQV